MPAAFGHAQRRDDSEKLAVPSQRICRATRPGSRADDSFPVKCLPAMPAGQPKHAEIMRHRGRSPCDRERIRLKAGNHPVRPPTAGPFTRERGEVLFSGAKNTGRPASRRLESSPGTQATQAACAGPCIDVAHAVVLACQAETRLRLAIALGKAAHRQKQRSQLQLQIILNKIRPVFGRQGTAS